jgi:hypothetical protein
LVDILKEAEFATGFTSEFTSVVTREAVPKAVLRRRMLLVLFALRTNMGIKRVAVTGKHGESEAVLRRVRHLFANRTNLRAVLVRLVNATFAARDETWWGEGAACASDSKKFGSWSSNFMTEWHQRYRGPGVMIYWHVEKNAELRREINDGLQVVENWNSANHDLFYGKDGDLTGSDKESQRSRCWRRTCSSRRWCTSTPCFSSTS